MANEWSREENEATVADYLRMLALERAGVDFNKSEHRRALSPLLAGRTDDAIQWKDQNISAALRDMGLPWIEGYKPASNYQSRLYAVVAEQVEASRELLTRVAAEVIAPATVPTVDDILAVLVAAPKAEVGVRWPAKVKSTPRRPRIVNYLEIEARNRSLGSAGEEFVVRYEVARLLAERADRHAKNVERVSVTRGDGLGCDILSFDRTGRERLIEVKTTAYAKETPFFVSANEVEFSRESASNYHLYRVFDFRQDPRLWWKQGQLDSAFQLQPAVYSARVR